MTPGRRLALLAVLATTPLTIAAGALASVRIAVEPAASRISAAGGAVAWSHLDAGDGLWRLEARIHGRTVALPIAPRRVPFDESLGRDPAGRLVAVYSRCSHESAVWLPSAVIASTPLPAGCRIFAYDVETHRERRLAGVPGSGWLPAIRGDRLAWVRRGRSGAPQLVTRTLPAVLRRRGARAVRLRAGRLIALPGGTSGSTGHGALGLALGDAVLAVDWASGDGRGTLSSDLLLDSLPGPRAFGQVTVDALTASPAAPGLLLPPAITGPGPRAPFVYGKLDASALVPPGDELLRVGPDAGEQASAVSSHALRSVAADGGTVYELAGPPARGPEATLDACGGGGCLLVARRSPL